MSDAYKCDVCGKFCSDCYRLNSNLFTIYPSDFTERGYKKSDKEIKINDMCEDCYMSIRKYIHNKAFKKYELVYKEKYK